MSLADSFRFALGQPLPGGKLVLSVFDNARHVTAWMYPDGELVIGFDCTQGAIWPPETDWIQNLMAWPKSLTVGSTKYKAMAGFVGEYLSVREEISDLVHVLLPSRVSLYGFSQGSAHATLCWRDLTYRYPGLEVHAKVFASPRVYDYASAQEFNLFLANSDPLVRTFERYECWGDPVAHLPPFLLNYTHVGPVKMIGPFKLLLSPEVHEGSNYLQQL